MEIRDKILKITGEVRVNTGLAGMIGLKSQSDLAPPLITSGLLRDFHAQQPANSPQPRSWDPNIVRPGQTNLINQNYS